MPHTVCVVLPIRKDLVLSADPLPPAAPKESRPLFDGLSRAPYRFVVMHMTDEELSRLPANDREWRDILDPLIHPEISPCPQTR